MMFKLGWRFCLVWLSGLVALLPAASYGMESTQRDLVVIDAQAIDAGVVFPLAILELDGRLTNTTTKAIRIHRIVPRATSSRDEVLFTPTLLQPGQSMDLKVKAEVGEHVGRFSLVYFAFADSQVEPVAKVAVRGFVDWIVDPESTRFDAGIIKAGTVFRHEFVPLARSGIDVRFGRADATSGVLGAIPHANGRSVIVSSTRKLPWGPFDESVVVRTNDPNQPKVLFRVFGQVRGAVVPSPESIEYGLIREGQIVEQIVRLTDETNRALRVGNVSVTGSEARASIEQCIPASESCRLVRVSMTGPEIGSAKLRGVVKIELPDYGEVLPIAFGGALIGKNTVVQDAAKAMEASNSSGLSAVLRASTVTSRPIEMPIPAGKGPLLSWETADESEIYGYEIYRATSEHGVYERVNQQIIKKVSEDPAAIGSIYHWRDTRVGSGTYWYYIGIVKLNGSKSRLSSPSKITVPKEVSSH